jgi:hypothetical protein
MLNPASSPLLNFTEAHWDAFKTSADSSLGAPTNVLMLYGFWGESYPWMQSLFSPKDTPLVFIPALLALSIVIIVGTAVSVRARETRPRALTLLCIGVAAFIFSVGLAPSYFYNFNLWLFEHVPFWRGFRDTEKWSMWLALSYAYLFAAGASYIAARLRARIARVAQFALILLPLAYTFTMLGGFAGQIRAVEYPESWHEVNTILAKDPDCKALFLPWHQYYRLAFNNLLTANTASSFFDCEIISSADAEIGKIGEQGNSDPAYLAIAEVVVNNAQDLDAALAVLRRERIKYVIFTNDIEKYDVFTYYFLAYPKFEIIYNKTLNNKGIVLLRL